MGFRGGPPCLSPVHPAGRRGRPAAVGTAEPPVETRSIQPSTKQPRTVGGGCSPSEDRCSSSSSPPMPTMSVRRPRPRACSASSRHMASKKNGRRHSDIPRIRSNETVAKLFVPLPNGRKAGSDDCAARSPNRPEVPHRRVGQVHQLTLTLVASNHHGARWSRPRLPPAPRPSIHRSSF